MSFKDFLAESKQPKLGALYDLLQDELPKKSNSMARISTYMSKEDNLFFVSYEGKIEISGGEEDDHAEIFQATLKDGEWIDIKRYGNDDELRPLVKDLKRHYPDLVVLSRSG